MSTFFNQLKGLGLKSMNLEIGFLTLPEGEKVSVIVRPKTEVTDPAFAELQPLVLRGTVEQLDEKFFEIITKSLTPTVEMFTNAEAYQAAQEKANAEAKHNKKEEPKKEKATKEKTATTPPPPKAEETEAEKLERLKKEKQDKIDAAVQKFEDYRATEGLDAVKEKSKLQKLIADIHVLDPDNARAAEFTQWLIKASEPVSLFSADDDELFENLE